MRSVTLRILVGCGESFSFGFIIFRISLVGIVLYFVFGDRIMVRILV